MLPIALAAAGKMQKALREHTAWPWVDLLHPAEERDFGEAYRQLGRIAVEHVWAEVEAIEGGIVVGVLDNDPVNLHSLRCGDRVRVEVADVEDWVFSHGKEMTGAFSVKAVERAGKRYRGAGGSS